MLKVMGTPVCAGLMIRTENAGNAAAAGSAVTGTGVTGTA
jgi:hypothetical protein